LSIRENLIPSDSDTIVILLGSTRLDINRLVLLGNDLTCSERREPRERRGSGAPSPVLDELEPLAMVDGCGRSGER
jgi:hypothetical protein